MLFITQPYLFGGWMAELCLMLKNENCKCAYCLFCRTGYERKVAEAINKRGKLLALPVMQEKHQSRNGVKSLVKKVMLPGYVFIYSDRKISIDKIPLCSHVIKFLKDADGIYELYEGNLDYARWVLKFNGLIACSKAMRIGSRVKVVEGPLKDYEGCIKEISKKNRNGRVEIFFLGRSINVWLPFDWVEG